jgi:hypothetical protein
MLRQSCATGGLIKMLGHVSEHFAYGVTAKPGGKSGESRLHEVFLKFPR